MEVRAVLPEEKLDDFLEETSTRTFKEIWLFVDSSDGDCIRIVYDNGDFEVISCNKMTKNSDKYNRYAGSFYANGEVKRFIGGTGLYPEDLSKWFNV